MTWFYKIFSYGFQSAFHIRLISSSVLPLVSGTALFTKIKAAIDSSMKCRKKALLSELVVLLSPYAPHITEELSAALGHEAGTLAQATFPTWQQEYVTCRNGWTGSRRRR
jgi:valyl-tRNA synthetase